MNYFETDIQNLTRKIKKIDDNPDPTKLKSNRMRYELLLEMRKAQLQAWKDGKSFASGIRYLSQAMGFIPGAGLSGAAIGIVTGGSSQYGTAQKYFDACRERGMPVEAACDMSMLPCGATEIKDVPDAPFDICDTATCTTMWLGGIYYMLQTKTPLVYYLDTGYRQDEADFNHVVNQLGEFIELSEKIPGIKYDEDRLIEIQSNFEQVQNYYREIYQMMKNKPSPISGKDTLTFNLNGFNSYPESAMPKWVGYAKLRRDEVGERLAKGQFAVPDEKARVVWTVTNPQYMDVQRVLFKHKIAMILQYGGLTHNLVPLPLPDYLEGRTLTPLEKVAYSKVSSLWAGTSSRWIDNLIWTCRDLGADGIVYYNMLGCGATLGLRKMVEDKAEEELGIPTLQLEGKQWDTDYASPEAISSKLDEFAQLVLSRKDTNVN